MLSLSLTHTTTRQQHIISRWRREDRRLRRDDGRTTNTRCADARGFGEARSLLLIAHINQSFSTSSLRASLCDDLPRLSVPPTTRRARVQHDAPTYTARHFCPYPGDDVGGRAQRIIPTGDGGRGGVVKGKRQNARCGVFVWPASNIHIESANNSGRRLVSARTH